MQVEVWKALLRRIPAGQLDNLMLMTAQGTEINVQALLRMDEDYMVLRGRLAGSNDSGRTFVMPYAHLDHIGFQKPLTDAELQATFDIVPAAAPPLPEMAAEPASPPPAPAAPAGPAPPPAPAPAAAPGLLGRLPTRSKIIQRLRLRTEVRDSNESPPKQ
jgi:hypothetical protein